MAHSALDSMDSDDKAVRHPYFEDKEYREPRGTDNHEIMVMQYHV